MAAKAEFDWVMGKAFVSKRLRPPKVTKSGKVIEKKRVCIEVPRLFLTGEFAFTRAFRCVPVVRGKKLSWSISTLTEPEKPLWPMLELHPNPKAGPIWKRWASMTEAEFSIWLTKVLGPDRATQAIGGMPMIKKFAGI